MKKFYVAPEAQLLKFHAEEAMAEGEELTAVSTEYEDHFGFQENDGNPWN